MHITDSHQIHSNRTVCAVSLVLIFQTSRVSSSKVHGQPELPGIGDRSMAEEEHYFEVLLKQMSVKKSPSMWAVIFRFQRLGQEGSFWY